MKNILLLHYDLHFYRIFIYNVLDIELKKRNINLIVWPIRVLGNINDIKFNLLQKDFSFSEYKKVLQEKKIVTVVNFIQPKTPSMTFYLQIIFYAYLKGLNLVYYGHGVNLESNSKLSNFMYNILHLMYKKIILYSPNEKKFLWHIHQKKIIIANNTLVLENRHLLIEDSKDNLKKKYNINAKFVILFSGRIEKRKKLELLIDFLAENYEKNINLIIVGPTQDDNLINRMKKNTNIIYFGPQYNTKVMSELFFISDVFSIPGHIGLGIVEAFYWGLPVLTLNVKHAPEIYYLENGTNGFILNNDRMFKEKILELYNNPILLKKLSYNARQTYYNLARLDKMIYGIIEGVDF